MQRHRFMCAITGSIKAAWCWRAASGRYEAVRGGIAEGICGRYEGEPRKTVQSGIRGQELIHAQVTTNLSTCKTMERGSSAVELWTHNQGSLGSNPPLLLFRRLGIFVLSIDTPVHSAV